MLRLEKCYGVVYAGEIPSRQVLPDLSEAFPVTGTHSSVSALLYLRARRLCCSSEQQCANNKVVKMHIQHCRNIVLEDYYCAFLKVGT